ncbi:MAG: methylated-DNA--[protein]-cysteine S-methyltransferase [Muribaculum sp.]|nr:methylated-DNA--[protein]-cysteine S-methyltransferase [Muribaculum sp.]
MRTIKIIHYHSPAGEIIIGSYGDKLCICDWAHGRRRHTNDKRICKNLNAVYVDSPSEISTGAIQQLEEYFEGIRTTFTIPILFTGTEFQCRVWNELSKIPYGTTITYAELARRIRNPKAVRAVASANATNPISIFIPCHRVIGSNHRLTGYGGGLDAKRMLLTLEAQNNSDNVAIMPSGNHETDTKI